MMKKTTIDKIIGLFLILTGSYLIIFGLEIVSDDQAFVESIFVLFLGHFIMFLGSFYGLGGVDGKLFISLIMLFIFVVYFFAIGNFGDISIFQEFIFSASASFCFLLSTFVFKFKGYNK